MKYSTIINTYLDLQDALPKNREYLLHNDIINILYMGKTITEDQYLDSLYLIANHFSFFKQLSDIDRTLLRNNHSRDYIILKSQQYSFSFLLSYLNALLRRFHFELTTNYRHLFNINKITSLVSQLEQSYDENDIKYNSSIANSFETYSQTQCLPIMPD